MSFEVTQDKFFWGICWFSQVQVVGEKALFWDIIHYIDYLVGEFEWHSLAIHFILVLTLYE